MQNLEKFLLENQNPIPADAVILVVCNSKRETKINQNYGSFSIDTEFLSNDELSEIVSMVAAQDLPFRVFYDEKDFLNLLLSLEIDSDRLIVYNSAQNGIGPGRKALIPSICKYFGIRCTGSDPYRVCLCRDKFATFSILKTAGLPAPQSFLYFGDSVPQLELDVKYIAKPIYESSSIGITDKNIFIGKDFPMKHLQTLIETLSQPLMIQKFISGFEIEVPLLAGKNGFFLFDPVVLYRGSNPMMGDEILDYERIYNDDYSFTDLPCGCDVAEICNTAQKAAKLLGLKGLCRVDFRLTEDGEFFITDVSTNPHFINHSSVNYNFKKLGLSDKDIFHTIIVLS